MTPSLREFAGELRQAELLIDNAVAAGLPDYLGNLRKQSVVEWRLYRFGEMSNQLRDVLSEQFPIVPWVDIIRFRHRLAHHFDRIDPHVIFVIATYNFPKAVFALRALVKP